MAVVHYLVTPTEYSLTSPPLPSPVPSPALYPPLPLPQPCTLPSPHPPLASQSAPQAPLLLFHQPGQAAPHPQTSQGGGGLPTTEDSRLQRPPLRTGDGQTEGGGATFGEEGRSGEGGRWEG